jgi:hypothetical protein
LTSNTSRAKVASVTVRGLLVSAAFEVKSNAAPHLPQTG